LYRCRCPDSATGAGQASLQQRELRTGKVEGILDFCAKADPQSAAKYQEQKKALVKDATEKEVAEARQSQQY